MDGIGDGKDAGALRTIGEVAAQTGIKPHVLRYWEEQFPMLKPLKRSGGRRYYRTEDVALVRDIDRLVNREGYTLKGAKAALKGGTSGAASQQRAVVSDGDREIVAQLKAIRDDLKRALAA